MKYQRVVLQNYAQASEGRPESASGFELYNR